MKINFGNLKVKLNIFHTFQQPPAKAECFFLDSVKDLVAESPPSTSTKYSFKAGTTYIQEDNGDTGQTIDQVNS